MAKILVVEDNKALLDFYEELFKTFSNHEVVLCDNPKDGLEIFEKENFDLILSDANFKGYNPKLTKLFLERSLARKTPVLVVSGQSNPKIGIPGLSFYSKPISNFDNFFETINSAIKNNDLGKKLTPEQTKALEELTSPGSHTEMATDKMLRELVRQKELNPRKARELMLLYELSELTKQLEFARNRDLPQREINALFERYLHIKKSLKQTIMPKPVRRITPKAIKPK